MITFKKFLLIESEDPRYRELSENNRLPDNVEVWTDARCVLVSTGKFDDFKAAVLAK